MKLKLISLNFIFFVAITAIATNATVTVIPAYEQNHYDHDISGIYKNVLDKNTMSLPQRITAASAYFLGKPYLLGALGEGQNGEFDQDPLYRTDAFDCLTYVETVMALADATNLQAFQQTIKKIRYKQGNATYVNRNHFTSVDWNTNNQAQGYLKDITNQLGATTRVTSTLINKPNWYRYKKISDLKLLHPISDAAANQLLKQWHQTKTVAVKSQVIYIPLSALFTKEGAQLIVQQAIFDRIPSGAIIEMVAANNGSKDEIGTDLNVLHMGFAIRTPQGLMFREASEVHQKVMDVPLTSYLARRYLYGGNPNEQGIHVEQIIFAKIYGIV